ncbi:hypothetical protein PA3_19480 [Acinetobacter pittii]|uniref:Uncharacterized protein n=1 Tax=Acinetobacter pittii TaxID=48296 RepID=A0A4Y3JAS0_ACIPI|nr:hypothetical protein PA3_19480 [Acinetobacter pittii]
MYVSTASLLIVAAVYVYVPEFGAVAVQSAWAELKNVKIRHSKPVPKKYFRINESALNVVGWLKLAIFIDIHKAPIF